MIIDTTELNSALGIGAYFWGDFGSAITIFFSEQWRLVGLDNRNFFIAFFIIHGTQRMRISGPEKSLKILRTNMVYPSEKIFDGPSQFHRIAEFTSQGQIIPIIPAAMNYRDDVIDMKITTGTTVPADSSKLTDEYLEILLSRLPDLESYGLFLRPMLRFLFHRNCFQLSH